MNNDKYNITETASMFSVTDQTVHKWIRTNKIHSHKTLAGKSYFTKEDLIEFTRRNPKYQFREEQTVLTNAELASMLEISERTLYRLKKSGKVKILETITGHNDVDIRNVKTPLERLEEDYAGMEYFTAHDLSAILGVSTATITRWERNNELTPIREKDGFHKKYARENVINVVKARTRES